MGEGIPPPLLTIRFYRKTGQKTTNIEQTVADFDHATDDTLARMLLAEPAAVDWFVGLVKRDYNRVSLDTEPVASRVAIHGRRRDSGAWEALTSLPTAEREALLPLWKSLA